MDQPRTPPHESTNSRKTGHSPVAIDTAKFINYAAARIPNSKIAAAMGLSESRVSQLLDAPKVQDAIAARRQEVAMEELEEKDTLRSARHKLMARVHDLIDDTESLGEAVTALERLNRMKDPEHSQPRGNQLLVAMELPEFLQGQVSIVLSSKNEIQEIEGRNMATMPTLATHRLLKDYHDQRRDDQGGPEETRNVG